MFVSLIGNRRVNAAHCSSFVDRQMNGCAGLSVPEPIACVCVCVCAHAYLSTADAPKHKINLKYDENACAHSQHTLALALTQCRHSNSVCVDFDYVHRTNRSTN